MNKILIMTDSNSGISQKEAKELGIFVIPMPFTINGEEFFEDINITKDEFFAYLDKDADVKTSQPSKFYLEELWTEKLKEYEEIIFMPMMSGLSGTCANAKVYAQNFNNKVQVVDNLRISVTLRESVLEAIVLACMGKTAVEIKNYLEGTGKIASIYIMLKVLKYLKKGGRISGAAASLGDMLKLKPILFSRGGNFEKYTIAMSVAQGKKKMIQKIKSELESEFKEDYEKGNMTVSVAHTQNEEEALKFKEEIMKELPKATFRFVNELSLSVSCHIGPGALAIAVCVNNYQ